MSSQVHTVKEFFAQIGINIQWNQIADFQPATEYSAITWNGVAMTVLLSQDVFSAYVDIGYVTNTGIAALYRRLLTDDSLCKWAIVNTDNCVRSAIHFPTSGVGVAELKWVLDTMANIYYQRGIAIQREFQLSQQRA